MIHSKQHRGRRIQDPGTRGYRWWKTADFSHSACTARSAPPFSDPHKRTHLQRGAGDGLLPPRELERVLPDADGRELHGHRAVPVVADLQLLRRQLGLGADVQRAVAGLVPDLDLDLRRLLVLRAPSGVGGGPHETAVAGHWCAEEKPGTMADHRRNLHRLRCHCPNPGD